MYHPCKINNTVAKQPELPSKIGSCHTSIPLTLAKKKIQAKITFLKAKFFTTGTENLYKNKIKQKTIQKIRNIINECVDCIDCHATSRNSIDICLPLAVTYGGA